MTFNESNTVEEMILDTLSPLSRRSSAEPLVLRGDPPPGWGGSLGGEFKPARWDYVPAAQA